jgi:copper(I)-binding protein
MTPPGLHAEDQKSPATVKIENARINAVSPTSTDSAAFMTIQNLSDESIRLVHTTSQISGSVMPMLTSHEKMNGIEVIGMKEVDYLEIPARGTLELEPGGAHLMLMGLTQPLVPGTTTKLVLHFSPGPDEMTVDAKVVKQ